MASGSLDAYEKAMSPAIRTIAEYEQCAREAGSFVKHVRVRGAQNDPRKPAGLVEVRVLGRWRRRLSPAQVDVVRRALAVRQIVGVTLNVRS